MSAPGPGLGAFLKKQAQEAEAALQKGTPKLGDGTKDAKEKDKSKDSKAEDASGKQKASAAKPPKQPSPKDTAKNDDYETMDSSVARIVNFSDSDADERPLRPRPAPELPPERPPMKPDVKNAMLGKKVYDGVSGMGQWIKGQQAPAQLSSGQRGIRRIQRAWSQHGSERLQQAKTGMTIDFCLKVLALWLLKKHRPRVHRIVELFCLAVPVADAICSWQQKWPHVPGRLGDGLSQTAQCSRQLAAPAAVADVAAWLHRKARDRCSSNSSSDSANDNGIECTDQPLDTRLTMRPIRTTRPLRTPRGSRMLRRDSSGDSPSKSRRLRSEGSSNSPGGSHRLHRESSGNSPSALDRQIDGLSELPYRRKIRKSRSAGGTPRDRSTPRARPMTPTLQE